MSTVRGRPVQDLPENQDPSVQFTYDEVTKQVTAWADEFSSEEKPAEEKPAKKRGRPPKAKDEEEGPDDGAAEGDRE